MMKKLSISAFLIAALAGAGFCADLSDLKIAALSKRLEPKWGRDPFQKFEDRHKEDSKYGGQGLEREENLSVIKVNGILSGGARGLAIINNEFRRRGDVVEGFRIVDISGDRVLVEKNGKRYPIEIDRFALKGKGARK